MIAQIYLKKLKKNFLRCSIWKSMAMLVLCTISLNLQFFRFFLKNTMKSIERIYSHVVSFPNSCGELTSFSWVNALPFVCTSHWWWPSYVYTPIPKNHVIFTHHLLLELVHILSKKLQALHIPNNNQSEGEQGFLQPQQMSHFPVYWHPRD